MSERTPHRRTSSHADVERLPKDSSPDARAHTAANLGVGAMSGDERRFDEDVFGDLARIDPMP